jgi:hypothetical protein
MTQTHPAATGKSTGLTKILDDIHWSFEAVDASLIDADAPFPYMGPSGLKPGVAESFKDPFQCLSICGGLNYELVCHLARNSNEYAHRHLLPTDRNNRRLHGIWNAIHEHHNRGNVPVPGNYSLHITISCR